MEIVVGFRAVQHKLNERGVEIEDWSREKGSFHKRFWFELLASLKNYGERKAAFK